MPTARQIAEIAANDEDAKALSAYVEQVFASVPAAGINGNPGQTEIYLHAGRLSRESTDCGDLPGGYAEYATHFKKGVVIYGFT